MEPGSVNTAELKSYLWPSKAHWVAVLSLSLRSTTVLRLSTAPRVFFTEFQDIILVAAELAAAFCTTALVVTAVAKALRTEAPANTVSISSANCPTALGSSGTSPPKL